MFFFNTRKNIVSELNLFKELIDTDIKLKKEGNC